MKQQGNKGHHYLSETTNRRRHVHQSEIIKDERHGHLNENDKEQALFSSKRDHKRARAIIV